MITTNPKKFLFVSLDALIGDTVWQLKKEGHQVKYYIEDKAEREIADGFVEKSTNWKADGLGQPGRKTAPEARPT